MLTPWTRAVARMSLATVWAWFTDPANWTGADGVPHRVFEHLLYTFLTLLIALVIAVPLGAWVGHSGRMRWLVTGANAARAVPTLGLLFAVSMLVGPLISSDLAFVIPSITVLVLLAIPPLLSGTYAGIDSVEPAARDAARGMGMTGLAGAVEGRGAVRAAALPQRTAQRDASRSSPPRPSPRPSASGVWAATSSTVWPRATTSRWSAGRSSSPCSRSSPTAPWPCSRDGRSHRESPAGHRVLLVHAPETPIPTPNHTIRRR